MAAGVEQYRGREQSFIKHEFLTQYLQAAAFKTLQGRSRTFNFVDAFAGPWEVSDTGDLSDTSFAQALNTVQLRRPRDARSDDALHRTLARRRCWEDSPGRRALAARSRSRDGAQGHPAGGARRNARHERY